MPSGYTVDLSARYCLWCGIDSDSARVGPCPSCQRDTCTECVKLYDEASYCVHTTPRQRNVLTHQEWT